MQSSRKLNTIAVLDDFQGAASSFGDWRTLESRGITIDWFTKSLSDPAEVAEALGSYDCIVAMRERTAFNSVVLERLPRLQLLICTGHTNNRAVDFPAARERGIVVCGTRNGPDGTAALTWALIHAITRHLPDELGSIRQGGWQTSIGMSLAGRRLGVLGLGQIGTIVAAVGHSFGMEVLAWSPRLTPERAARLPYVEVVSKQQLFAESHVVSVHLVLGDATFGIVGEHELHSMRKGSCLVNTSRAALVDQAALLDALRNGPLAAAGLDVFEEEPLPADHPYRSLPNVVATPHIGYVTDDTYSVFYGDAIADIVAYLDGAPIRVYSHDGVCEV